MAREDEPGQCDIDKPSKDEEGKLKGEDLRDEKVNREVLRLWISGLEAVHQELGIWRVIDLSAVPLFSRGCGYANGTLFPWTMRDSSAMDAIKRGVVAHARACRPRHPCAKAPMYRGCWTHLPRDTAQGEEQVGGHLTHSESRPGCRQRLRRFHVHCEEAFRLWNEVGSTRIPESLWSATPTRPQSSSTAMSPSPIAKTRTEPCKSKGSASSVSHLRRVRQAALPNANAAARQSTAGVGPWVRPRLPHRCQRPDRMLRRNGIAPGANRAPADEIAVVDWLQEVTITFGRKLPVWRADSLRRLSFNADRGMGRRDCSRRVRRAGIRHELISWSRSNE